MTLLEFHVLCIIAIFVIAGAMYDLRHLWWPPWQRKTGSPED